MNGWPQPTHDSVTARLYRLRYPGWGWCLRCGRPWPVASEHSTDYSETDRDWYDRGCFPLCERCWQLLATPEGREPYYWTLIRTWDASHPVSERTMHAILAAVREGR